MLVDDYTPMKRVGMEELEGLVRTLERRIDAATLGEPTPASWMDEGAWLALHMVLTGRFRYANDFMAVFDEKKKVHIGEGV